MTVATQTSRHLHLIYTPWPREGLEIKFKIKQHIQQNEKKHKIVQQEQEEEEKWAKYGNMAKQRTETIKEKDGRRTNKQEGPSVQNTH